MAEKQNSSRMETKVYVAKRQTSKRFSCIESAKGCDSFRWVSLEHLAYEWLPICFDLVMRAGVGRGSRERTALGRR
jgi:hypothetical protein